MFLTSTAFAQWAASGQPAFSWPGVNVLFVSHDWNPACDGAEALAGRRLVHCLIDAGARVHVLAAARADDEFEHPRYRVTVVAPGTFPVNKAARALQMVRSTVPESAGQWVPAAVDAGLHILRALPADTVIYGRAAPGVSNIVAWHIARTLERPFVAHFSDAWPSFHLLSYRHRWLAPYKLPLFALWRGRIVRDAAALTFTNPAEAAEVTRGNTTGVVRKTFVAAHLPSAAARPVRAPRFESFPPRSRRQLLPAGTHGRSADAWDSVLPGNTPGGATGLPVDSGGMVQWRPAGVGWSLRAR